MGTRADPGVYVSYYLSLDKLNWQTFTEEHFNLARGITLHLSPGHTPGLVMMQVNLQQDGTFIFTTDQCHVKEHFELQIPQGWLNRDYPSWVRSIKKLERLQKMFNATLMFGHDKEVAEELIARKPYFS